MDKPTGPGSVGAKVREYILTEVLPSEDSENLTDSTSLIASGILDSIATAQMVAYLESEYSVQFKAHEVSVDRLDSIALIESTLREKLENKDT